MTGEMSREEVTAENFPLHFAVTKEFGGTVEPFDQYQGPYIALNGARFWLSSEDGVLGYWFNERDDRFSAGFFPNSATMEPAVAAFRDLIEHGGSDTAPTIEEPPLHVLIVDHRYGQNVSIHRTKEAATASLAKWCREYWKQEMPAHRRMPKEDGDVVAAYFDYMGDRGESYAIHEAKIED